MIAIALNHLRRKPISYNTCILIMHPLSKLELSAQRQTWWFRQLYIVRISSIPICKLRAVWRGYESLRDVSTEMENYHKFGEINLPALLCELLFIPIFMGIQALIVFPYYYLPGPISSVQLNVMNLLQLVPFFGTGQITYKLFTFGAPTEEIIFHGFMRAYGFQEGSQSSRDAAERTTQQQLQCVSALRSGAPQKWLVCRMKINMIGSLGDEQLVPNTNPLS